MSVLSELAHPPTSFKDVLLGFLSLKVVSGRVLFRVEMESWSSFGAVGTEPWAGSGMSCGLRAQFRASGFMKGFDVLHFPRPVISCVWSVQALLVGSIGASCGEESDCAEVFGQFVFRV